MLLTSILTQSLHSDRVLAGTKHWQSTYNAFCEAGIGIEVCLWCLRKDWNAYAFHTNLGIDSNSSAGEGMKASLCI